MHAHIYKYTCLITLTWPTFKSVKRIPQSTWPLSFSNLVYLRLKSPKTFKWHTYIPHPQNATKNSSHNLFLFPPRIHTLLLHSTVFILALFLFLSYIMCTESRSRLYVSFCPLPNYLAYSCSGTIHLL